MSFITRTLKNLYQIGPREYLRQMMYIGDTKHGILVGTDHFGNKYYENKDEFYGRDRWIEYAQHYGDASQIPPEWHSWIHKVTDEIPTVNLKYISPHTENFTGTRKAFKTYNTTAPKIQSWEPKVGRR